MDPRYEPLTKLVFGPASSLVIRLLMVIWAMGCSTGGGDSLTGGEQPVPATGTIRVTVTSGGSLIQGAVTIKVTGPIERTRAGAIGGTSTFVDLPAGTYAVAATSPNRAIACQSATANLVAGASATADIICTPRTGTIRGTVSNGGAPISGATIKLTGSSRGEITTSADGTFTIVVMIGEVTLTPSHAGFVCPQRTVMVEEAQTATANISCTPNLVTTGSIAGRVVVSQVPTIGIGDLLVTLSGPVVLTTTIGHFDGSFAFRELEPGSYTLNATAFGINCSMVSPIVQAGQTTTVLLTCTVRPPFGTEIEGTWSYYRRLESTSGTCPPPLPEVATGSMRLGPSNGTIVILGLDPELEITGSYDLSSGSFTGSGRTVLDDGSSIRADLGVRFSFFWWEYGFDWWGYGPVAVFSTGLAESDVLFRRHHDPAGELVCTEIYHASGGPL